MFNYLLSFFAPKANPDLGRAFNLGQYREMKYLASTMHADGVLSNNDQKSLRLILTDFKVRVRTRISTERLQKVVLAAMLESPDIKTLTYVLYTEARK